MNERKKGLATYCRITAKIGGQLHSYILVQIHTYTNKQNTKPLVKVLKMLNDQQSNIITKIVKSKNPSQYKLSYSMSIRKGQAILK